MSVLSRSTVSVVTRARVHYKSKIISVFTPRTLYTQYVRRTTLVVTRRLLGRSRNCCTKKTKKIIKVYDSSKGPSSAFRVHTAFLHTFFRIGLSIRFFFNRRTVHQDNNIEMEDGGWRVWDVTGDMLNKPCGKIWDVPRALREE